MRFLLLAFLLLSQIGCFQEANNFAGESHLPPHLLEFPLKSSDPCFKLQSEPSKALEDHLKSLKKEEAAQHFYEGLVKGARIEKIIPSKEVDYLKWFIISMSYFDTIKMPDKEAHLSYFINVCLLLIEDKTARKYIKGEKFPGPGISFFEYKEALNKLNNVENEFNAIPRTSENDANIAMVVKSIRELIVFTFLELLSSEDEPLTEFSRDFLSWSKEEWFKKYFSVVINLLKKYSLNLSFTKEKFIKLEKRVEDQKKILQNYVDKKLIDKSMFMGKKINLLYNNIGFESGVLIPKGNNKILGKQLDINGIKTGYNIYFPEALTSESALIVHVYGGFGVDNKNADFIPSSPSLFMYKLLDNNMVLAELNLPDRLKLRVPQGQMDKNLHEEIHRSIHNFFEVVSQDPELLLPKEFRGKLAGQVMQLKTMPKYIFGSSYGGRTAVRHIQLYPHTFDGAISHAGGLLGRSAKRYLWPVYFINDIKQKVLLLHNLDDARVNVRESIVFSSTALLEHKDMQLYLNWQGNPTALDNGLLNLSLKGHFFPTREDYFDRYGQRILDFIAGKPYQNMAKQNRIITSLQEGEHLKTNHSRVWYALKESIFYRVKDINKRHEIRSFIDDLAAVN